MTGSVPIRTIIWAALSLLVVAVLSVPGLLASLLQEPVIVELHMSHGDVRGGGQLELAGLLFLGVGAAWVGDRTSRPAVISLVLAASAISLAVFALARTPETVKGAEFVLRLMGPISAGLAYAAIAGAWRGARGLGLGLGHALALAGFIPLMAAAQAIGWRQTAALTAGIAAAVLVVWVSGWRQVYSSPVSVSSKGETAWPRLAVAFALLVGLSSVSRQMLTMSLTFGEVAMGSLLQVAALIGAVAGGVSAYFSRAGGEQAQMRLCAIAAATAGGAFLLSAWVGASNFAVTLLALGVAAGTFSWPLLLGLAQSAVPPRHGALTSAALLFFGQVAVLAISSFAMLSVWFSAGSAAAPLQAQLGGGLTLNYPGGFQTWSTGLPFNVSLSMGAREAIGVLLRTTITLCGLAYLAPVLLLWSPRPGRGTIARSRPFLAVSTPMPARAANPVVAEPDAGSQCFACAGEVSPGAKFCRHCGLALAGHGGAP